MDVLLQGFPQKNDPPELDLTVERAMQLTVDVLYILLYMSHSTTSRRLPYSAMELSRAETKNSATQLKAHLQAALVKQFPENDDNVDQSTCQIADST
jgi:hypothetical protein